MTREQMEKYAGQMDLLKECQKEFESTLKHDCHNDYVMENLVGRIKKITEDIYE